jgi:hypothetical protein
MNTKAREEILKHLLGKIEREKVAVKPFDEFIRRRIAAKDPEALVSAFMLNKPDIGPEYWDKWDRELESAATDLERVGACDAAKSIREYKPINLDPSEYADPNEKPPVFDVEALRDRVVAMLGDLAEDREASHGLETGGSSGEPDAPQLQMTQEDPQLIAATANAGVRAQLLSIFTNGMSDQRFEQAVKVAADESKTVNDRLTEIDERTPFPPTASARDLAKLLRCTHPAIIALPWWQEHRAGNDKKKQREREIAHKARAKNTESGR